MSDQRLFDQRLNPLARAVLARRRAFPGRDFVATAILGTLPGRVGVTRIHGRESGSPFAPPASGYSSVAAQAITSPSRRRRPGAKSRESERARLQLPSCCSFPTWCWRVQSALLPLSFPVRASTSEAVRAARTARAREKTFEFWPSPVRRINRSSSTATVTLPLFPATSRARS